MTYTSESIGMITIWRQILLKRRKWSFISVRLEQRRLAITLSLKISYLKLSCAHMIISILKLLVNYAIKKRPSVPKDRGPGYRIWSAHKT